MSIFSTLTGQTQSDEPTPAASSMVLDRPLTSSTLEDSQSLTVTGHGTHIHGSNSDRVSENAILSLLPQPNHYCRTYSPLLHRSLVPLRLVVLRVSVPRVLPTLAHCRPRQFRENVAHATNLTTVLIPCTRRSPQNRNQLYSNVVIQVVSMVNRLLHCPTVTLNKSSQKPNAKII
jgi:hypothetical protein